MAIILSDKEIKKLIEYKIIIDGNDDCVRPNAYMLRLGKKAEYTHIHKEFDISGNKSGIKLPMGNSIHITSHEKIDFRREVVHKLYPKCDLLAYMSPITDLSREGIITQTTQIDAGFYGVINWTINNTSHNENEFFYKERLYRLTIFKLENGEEIPITPYQGHYQGQEGIVHSKRQGAHKGMKSNNWHHPITKESPEKYLENLINSGYPWNILGQQLKELDGQFGTVTNEYENIKTSLDTLVTDVHDMPNKMDKAIGSKQSKWLINITVVISGFIGLGFTVFSSQVTNEFIKDYAGGIGISILLITIGVGWFNNKK